MKVKYLWASLIALALFSCDDTTDSMGLSMMPSRDDILVKADVFDVNSETTLAGPVFAKTSMGCLGKYTDPEFGNVEADFITQLTCTDKFEFPLEKMVPVDKTASTKKYEATSATITLHYVSYFGNPISTNRMSVYELNKDLVKDNKNYYTNIDPTQFYSSSTDLIAQKAYSPVDLSVDESVRNSSTYYPVITIKFPIEKANKYIALFKKCKAENTDFKKAFANELKGLYFKCDFGEESILYIEQVHLNISFKMYAMDTDGKTPLKKKEKDHVGEDSTYVTSAQFGSTKEIIQANRFQSDKKLEELKNEAVSKNYTYIKSPAGLLTKIKLPISKISAALPTDTLNIVKFTINAYNSALTNKYGMSAPKTLLLIRGKDKDKFFEENNNVDYKTSFLANFANNQYVFADISRLISTCISERKTTKVTDDEEVYLIPVSVLYEDQSKKVPLSIQHDLKPAYVKLKGGPSGSLKLEVIHSKLNLKLKSKSAN